MARKFTLQIKQNLKHSMTKQELTDDVSALLAAVTWVLPSTLLNLNGYAGLGVAFASTWGLGALFNIPGLRRAAWALGAVQLVYTAGREPIEKALDKPLWRMDETGGETTTNGLAAAIQAGARMTQLPNGTYAPSYDAMDGMMDRFSSSYATDTLQGANGLQGYSDDYGSPAAVNSSPIFSTSPF
jgi:hypothetical protein